MNWMKRNILQILIIQACTANLSSLFAQVNGALQKRISISMQNVQIKQALSYIEKSAGVTFSYSNSAIDIYKKISIHLNNVTIAQSLDVIFNHEVLYTANGSTIVFRPKELYNDITITGKVIEAEKLLALADVSVFERKSLVSCVTNSMGQFVLKIKAKLQKIELKFARKDYRDTVVSILERKKQIVLTVALLPNWVANSAIKPIPLPELKDSHQSSYIDSVQGKNKPQWINTETAQIPSTNKNFWERISSQLDSVKNDWRKEKKWIEWDLLKNVLVKQSKRTLGVIDSVKNSQFEDSNKRKVKKELQQLSKDFDSTLLHFYEQNKSQLASDSNLLKSMLDESAKKLKKEISKLLIDWNLNTEEEDKELIQIWEKKRKKFMAKWQQIHENNIRDSFERNVQLSLISPLGTNGFMSGHITNKFSFNAIGGYARGVNGVEIGGIYNVNKRDVRGFQCAGILNITGNNTHGFQIAGIANQNFGFVKGFQCAGIYNMVKKEIEGTQIAGILNSSRTFKGLQIAGIGNIALRHSKGFQLAGIVNIAGKHSSVNQLGGIVNIAKKINGAQISGIINIADSVSGVQIGLINISSRMKGVPIGLLNFSKNGYHPLSLSFNSEKFVDVTFRSGVRAFYTSWSMGYFLNSTAEKPIVNYGFGLGSSIRLYKKLFLNLEGEYKYLHVWSKNYEQFNYQVKASSGLQLQLLKKLAISAGFVLNGMMNNTDYAGYNEVKRMIPSTAKTIKEWNSKNHLYQYWPGWYVNIMFF